MPETKVKKPSGITSPLTDFPSRVAKGISNRISPPNQVGSPMRGFMSGAVEGTGDVLSDMTSPLGIASSLAGAPWMRGLVRGGKAINRAANPTMDIIDSPAVGQVMPSMDDVGSLMGDMQRNLARIPSSKKLPQPAGGINPGILPAELVGVGQEAAFNAPRITRSISNATNLDDIAEAGSRVAGKVRMPFGNNIDVADKMAKLNKARGKT